MKARITLLDPETNSGKVHQLDLLHAEHIQYVQSCVKLMVSNRIFNVLPSGRKSYFPTSEILSSQLVKNAQAQAVELVHGWVNGVYGRTLKAKITGLKEDGTYNDLDALQLYTIGKYRLTHGGKFGKGTISQELVDLYWSWVWDPEIVGNPPTISERFPLRFTEMTCTFRESGASHFHGWWLKFSSLTRYKTIFLPLKESPFLRKRKDVQLTVLAAKRPDGHWTFQFSEKSEDPVLDGSAGKLGIDVGLNVLAATSSGTLYGQRFKAKFNRLKKRVDTARANRKRQGFLEDSRRLWALERRLSGQIKTATNTIANQLVKSHPNTTFVVEDLDLSSAPGSKRFAYRALQSSLERKAVTEKVNPAYTSQECPSCHFVSRSNRRGVKFVCQSCGRKSHADFVGGSNLLGRSGDNQIGLKTSVKSVKAILDERHRLRFRSPRSLLVGAHTDEPGAYCDVTEKIRTRIASKQPIPVRPSRDKHV